jgi:tRNA pseudouridine38/39 synthase
MKEAASYLVGTHNFQNFCKLDHSRENQTLERTIYSSEIQPCDLFNALTNKTEYQPFIFSIRGKGFLYHQIRCIMSILFLIGKGLEEPFIITDLLDTNKYPMKPSYEMASEIPLILWECEFLNKDIQWSRTSEESQGKVLHHFYKLMHEKCLRGLTSWLMFDGWTLSTSSSNTETYKDTKKYKSFSLEKSRNKIE